MTKKKAAEAPVVEPKKKPMSEQLSTRFIPIGKLFVDPLVQRGLNVAWANKIALDFDPDYIGVVHVSDRRDGTYAIIDGQHRISAVRQLFGDDDQMVECKVYSGLDIPQEAALFVALNNFKSPSAIQQFIKNVVAGDPEAVEINRIANNCGYKISTWTTDGYVSCVRALELVYRGFSETRGSTNPALLTQTLTIIRNAWGDSKDGVKSQIVEGVARLVAARGKVIDYPVLIARLAAFPGGGSGLLGRGRGLAAMVGGKVPAAIAEVILDAYNKNRRSDKLESLRR